MEDSVYPIKKNKRQCSKGVGLSQFQGATLSRRKCENCKFQLLSLDVYYQSH